MTGLPLNPFGYDADAEDYFARYTAGASGGTLSALEVQAVRRKFYHLKATGIWSKMDRIGGLIGSNLTGALIPQKKINGNTTDTNSGYVSGDWSQSLGLNTGTSKYLDTGLTAIAAGMTVGNGCLGVYGNVNTNNALGGAQTSTNDISCNTSGGVWTGNFAGASCAINVLNRQGFQIVNAVGGQANVFKYGIPARTTDVASAGTLPTHTFYIGAKNVDGTASSFASSQKILGYYIGAALTKAEVHLLNKIEQNFQRELGRGFVGDAGGRPMVCIGESTTRGTNRLRNAVAAIYTTKQVFDHGVDGETSTQVKVRLLANPALDDAIVVMWAGRNNVGTALATVQTDTAEMVAWVEARQRVAPGAARLVVICPMSGRTIATEDGPAGAAYLNFEAMDAWILSNYPNYYGDAKGCLQSHNIGDATDLADLAKDNPPNSEMVDTIHQNATGSTNIATDVVKPKVDLMG